MKKWKIALAAVLSLTVGVAGNVFAEDEPAKEVVLEGAGTQEDPYLIGSPEEFQEFAFSVNDGSMGGYSGKYIKLTEDIDLEGVDWYPIGTMKDMETYSTMFMGDFDGDGHTISNLVYVSDTYNCGAGLFGVSLGSVSNLTVENATVTVNEPNSIAIGCVIGYNMYGTVDNIHLTGTNHVTGNNCTGGIIGGNSNGHISNCSAEGLTVTVIGDNDFSSGRLIQVDVAEVGGLIVGGSFGGTIDNCTAAGTVEASGNEPVGMGGIGGCLEMMDSITNCTADVTIRSEQGGHAIGGLCGYAGTHSDPNVAAEEGTFTENYPAIIQNCQATVDMEVPGATHVGGLVGTGLYYYGEETVFAMSDCIVSGTINGAVTPGAVCGRAEGCTIENVEADVTADGEPLTEQIGTTDRMYESADQYEDDGEGVLSAIAGENGTTYVNLFDVILSEDCYQTWHDACAAIVGEENAADTVAFMQGYISSDIYGEEAIEAFSNAEGGMAFDCFYINDAAEFTFDGDTITTVKTDGTSETHTYEYLGQYNIGEGETMNYMGQEINVAFPCDVYKSTDEAGEFNYFFLRDDTMETTYHIEFRYGKDLEELQGYFVGPYAYWLSAGLDKDADEQTLENVIELFCLENMDYSSRTEESLAQIADLTGTWTADLSAFGEAYADTELFFVIDENGHGETTMNGEKTADFEAYMYDSGEKGDGAGIYVAYSNLEYSAEAADYTLENNEDGEPVLTLYADDGVISWVKTA